MHYQRATWTPLITPVLREEEDPTAYSLALLFRAVIYMPDTGLQWGGLQWAHDLNNSISKSLMRLWKAVSPPSLIGLNRSGGQGRKSGGVGRLPDHRCPQLSPPPTSDTD